MDTRNSRKKSPRDSEKTEQQRTAAPDTEQRQQRSRENDNEDRYYDRSIDHVERVRLAREVARRKMEEFGDPSEYDITIIQGELKEEPDAGTQATLDFSSDDEPERS